MDKTNNQYKKIYSAIKGDDETGFKYVLTKFPYISSTNKDHYDEIIEDYVHDGDTVNVLTNGTYGIRFLGVDTPEVSIDYPSVIKPDNLGDRYKWPRLEEYKEYLADPFRYKDSEKFKQSLGNGLLKYLNDKLNPDTAENHQAYGDMALKELRSIVKQDILEYYSDAPKRDFSFFMVFAFEIMDRYGRFLCYVDKTKTKDEQQKDKWTYNEKLLQRGLSIPYFIWPNINPFRKDGLKISTIKDAIYHADEFYEKIKEDKRLSEVRKSVQKAQLNHQGIFAKVNPLLIQPFELRYLFRRQSPDRYVLDMSSKDHPTILTPTEYHTISYENRLFIDEAYLPLFKQKGYSIQGEVKN